MPFTECFTVDRYLEARSVSIAPSVKYRMVFLLIVLQSEVPELTEYGHKNLLFLRAMSFCAHSQHTRLRSQFHVKKRVD